MPGRLRLDILEEANENQGIVISNNLINNDGNPIITFSANSSGYIRNVFSALGARLVKQSHFVNSTRVGLADSNAGTIWSVDIAKEFGSTVSELVVFGQLVGHDNYSDLCGIYAHIPGSTTLSTDGTAFMDISYVGGNADSETFNIILTGKRFSNLNEGTHTLTIGWSTKNNSTTDKPFVVWNPNSTDDARQHQTRSQLYVQELFL